MTLICALKGRLSLHALQTREMIHTFHRGRPSRKRELAATERTTRGAPPPPSSSSHSLPNTCSHAVATTRRTGGKMSGDEPGADVAPLVAALPPLWLRWCAIVPTTFDKHRRWGAEKTRDSEAERCGNKRGEKRTRDGWGERREAAPNDEDPTSMCSKMEQLESERE